MCLALPSLVVASDGDDAVVELGGIRKTVSAALVPEAQVGDYVIVHVGHAIGVLDPDEAARTLALFAELEDAQAAEAGAASVARAAAAASMPGEPVALDREAGK
jgi:hydrogenase expression/formation protein HypC